MNSAGHWIETLQLQPHPEGGWFREVYRASEGIASSALPARFAGERSFSTAIYYLLEGDEVSKLHRINQDEVWHFYDGSALSIHSIDESGNASHSVLGRQTEQNQSPMVVIPFGAWFGAHLNEDDSYCLAGCTVSPGFDFEDFELASRSKLLEVYPQHRELIERLT